MDKLHLRIQVCNVQTKILVLYVGFNGIICRINKMLNNRCCVILAYRGIQHNCNNDERHKPIEVNMFKQQNQTKNQEPQRIVIKSPKNLRRCRNPEYRWRFYNLSPNHCKVNINCNKFTGGDCGKGDYILQLFFIDHWNSKYKEFHSDKEEKENQKVCRKNEIHHRIVKTNQVLVIELVFLIDAADLEEDAGFSCQLVYDCRKPNTNIPSTTEVPNLSVIPTLNPTSTIFRNVSLSTTTMITIVGFPKTETTLQVATTTIKGESSKYFKGKFFVPSLNIIKQIKKRKHKQTFLYFNTNF